MVSTIWALAHWYVGARLIRPLDLTKARRRAAWAVVAAVWALAPLAMVTGRPSVEGAFLSPLLWAGFVHMGIFSVVVPVLLLRDAVWLLGRGLERLRRWRAAVDEPRDPVRRRFLLNATNAGVVGASSVLAGWGFAEARRLAEVVRVDVPVRGLPEELDGYAIAQITDLHVGPTIGREYTRLVVDAVNALEPDLVAVTGDMVDGRVDELRPHVEPLASLRSRDGTFFVTGNHEYYSGAEEWIAEMARLGMVPLVNAHRLVERGGARLLVAGVTDISADRILPEHASDPAGALEGAPPSDLKVLLAHQPRSIWGAARAGFDLQLSGHTHGGQFFPWTLFVGLAHPFTEGLHLYRRTWIYVSRGTGYWGPPHRGGAPSEITLLRLRRVG